MPDYESFGFAYITPRKLENALGFAFYPQINILSDMEKADLEQAIKDATGTTFLVTTKDEHVAYAGVLSEAEEGKTMGSILPVLFLAIAILTMVTTMHRITANEKVQIGTLKVLGFRDKAIGKLLITQNIWLTLIGVVLGLPGGVGVLYVLVTALAGEYELSLILGPATYVVSIVLAFGVSLLVGWMVAGKNRKIDMVEALKGAE